MGFCVHLFLYASILFYLLINTFVPDRVTGAIGDRQVVRLNELD